MVSIYPPAITRKRLPGSFKTIKGCALEYADRFLENILKCTCIGNSKRLAKIMATLSLAVILPEAQAEDLSLREKINRVVGRPVYVDQETLPEKIHTYSDIKRWIAPIGKDATRMPYPEVLKGSGISARVTVYVIITPDGSVLNPEVVDPEHKEMVLPAILHAAGLRFRIPRINGEPVYLRQRVALICSEDPGFTGKK